MSKKVYVYGLINPINNSLFYIGLTNNLKRRLSEHVRLKYNPNKDKIIEDIISKGYKPDIIELDSTDIIWNKSKNKFKHDLLEKEWIKRAKTCGNMLTNMTDGGSGVLGEINEIVVYKYDENGNYLNKYKSLTEASKKNNVSISKLSLALNQKVNKSSKGYYWFTSKENTKGFKFKKTIKKKIKIVSYDLEGNLYKVFNSQSEAERMTGIKSRQINKCLRQKNKKRAGDYQWFYYNDKSPNKINKWVDPNLKSILQLDLNYKLIKKYNSLNDASNFLNLNYKTIWNYLNGKTQPKNYILKYE